MPFSGTTSEEGQMMTKQHLRTEKVKIIFAEN